MGAVGVHVLVGEPEVIEITDQGGFLVQRDDVVFQRTLLIVVIPGDKDFDR